MRIVVFGASGRTGRQVVNLAVKREHEVVAAVRDASKQWFPDAVTVQQGDPNDADAVATAITGADAVISALGPIAGETETEISGAMQTIVETMQRTGPHRLVIAANTTVFSDREVTGEFANVAAEHRRDLAILQQSALAWTAVAAPILADEAGSGAYDAVVDGPAPGPSIARADFARRAPGRVDARRLDRARRRGRGYPRLGRASRHRRKTYLTWPLRRNQNHRHASDRMPALGARRWARARGRSANHERWASSPPWCS